MSKILYCFIVSLFLCFPNISYAGGKEDAIQKEFTSYRSALLDQDGNKAWDLCDTSTHQLYEKYLSAALTATRDDLNKIDVANKITILRLRMEFSKSQLEKFSGKDIFIIAVKNAWISKSTVESIHSLEHIEITGNGNYAIAAPLRNSPPVIFFSKEEGQWRIALWKIISQAKDYFQKEVHDSGLTEEAYVKQILETISLKKFDDAILDGPLN